MRLRRGLFALLVVSACAARADQASFAELRRDVTVAAFWATWCEPCRHELPLVEALAQKYKNDPHVRVVAVSVDSRRKAGAARKELSELGVTAPLVTDGEKLYFRCFGGDDTDVPRLAVIDKKGAGLDRNGAVAGETAEAFVRDVSAAIESVRAGQPRPPTLQWKPLTAHLSP